MAARIDAPEKVKEQLSTGVAQYRKVLQQARHRNANESDTAIIVHSILADIFGYDRFNEVTSEYKIKGQFVDFATKIGDKLSMLLEVKSIGLKLNDQHLFQAASYAAQEGVEWVALTNGAQWHLYRIEFKQPVTTTKVAAVDFLEPAPDEDALLAFHRWGMQRNVAESLWQRQSALAPANLVRAVLAEGVLKEIVVELRRSTGYRVDVTELQERLISDVLKEGLVGQVSVEDVGVSRRPGGRRAQVAMNGEASHLAGPPVEGTGSVRRVRLSHLLTAGLIRPGDTLTAEWDGANVTVTVLETGSVSGDGWSAPNLDEAARIVTGNNGQRGWEFWRCPTGENMWALRERFITNS
ncbi:MAG: hypothetical protein ACRDJE_20725 [Dehalococcoidia bacterium]